MYNILFITDVIHFQRTSHFNYCGVLVVYQVTVHNQSSKCLPPARVSTYGHELSHTAEVPEQSRIGRHQKYFGELCLHFQFDLSTLGFPSVAHNTLSACCWATPRKQVAAFLYWWELFVLFWCRTLNPEVYPSLLDTPCIISTPHTHRIFHSTYCHPPFFFIFSSLVLKSFPC